MRCSKLGIVVQSVLGIILFVQRGIRCDGTVDDDDDDDDDYDDDYDPPIIPSLEADSEGKLIIGEYSSSWTDINVESLPVDSLKHLELNSVNLIWDETEPIFLENLQDIELSDCKVNPHSLLFSDNLKSLEITRTEIINGTLLDLLGTANNLQILTISNMDETTGESIFLEHLQELELSDCKVNPHSLLFSENLKSLKILGTEIINGSLGDLLKAANNLHNLKIILPVDGTVSGNSPWPNIHVRSLPLNSLKHLKLSGVNLIWDGTEPISLEHLQELQLYNSKVNPHSLLFSGNVKSLEILDTEVINGTLGDLLETANNLQILSISSMEETDLSVLLSNHFMNQSPHSNPFFSNLVELTLTDTNLKNTRLADILNVSVNLKKLIIVSSGEIDVSKINTNHSNYLNGTEKYFGKELVYLKLENTTLVNGDLDSFFKSSTNLEELELNLMGDVDISVMPYSNLKSLTLNECNLKWTRKITFEKLKFLTLDESTMTDVKPFVEFNVCFPHLLTIVAGQKMIFPPKAILAMMNSSLTDMKFSFDCNPPISSYEFGEAMKFMLDAEFIHNDDANAHEEEAKKWVSEVKDDLSTANWKQRIHEVRFEKLIFENGSFKWTLTDDWTFLEVFATPELDIKSGQRKSLIYFYFVLVTTLLCFGIAGNFLSGFVLLMKKPKNSAGIILLGLTSFDFLVILTYVATAILNAELFHDMFLKTGLKSTLYSVDEHLWMSEQNRFQAFIIYPLNKTAYTGSVYTTILISLERFIAVCWPLKSKHLLRSRNSKLAILIILVFSIFLNIPRWIESYEWNYYSDESPYWNDYYKPTLMRMEIYGILYHGWIWTFLMYILPFVLIGFLNFKILRHLKHTKEERRSMQSARSNTEEQRRNEDAEMMSVTKMLLCVVAVFVLCNSLHIAIVFYFIMNYNEIQLSTIEAVSCLPIIINCSVNFIIYIYFGKTLRAEFLKLVPRWVYSCLSCCKRGQSTNIELSGIR